MPLQTVVFHLCSGFLLVVVVHVQIFRVDGPFRAWKKLLQTPPPVRAAMPANVSIITGRINRRRAIDYISKQN